MKIYLSPPHLSSEGYEQAYVTDVFASNWIAPLGAYVDRFEQELASRTERKGGVALSSGTAAIHLALKACGVAPGDNVICSAFTFAASCNPIIYEQGIPIFIDSDYETWNLDVDLVEKALADCALSGRPAKAVIAVSLYGQPANLPRLEELCKHYEVALIDEATEALGASVLGRPCGSFGRFGILSFNGNKIITTSGGGAVVGDDSEALAKMRFWATQSRDAAPHYQHSELGFNYRMSNLCAAVGCGQLQVLDEHVAATRAIYARYCEAFADIPQIEMMPLYAESTNWLSVITLANGSPIAPADIAQKLAAEDIESRPAWKPMNLQPYWQNYTFYAKDKANPVGDDIFRRGLCLPSGSNLLPHEQEKVISCVRSAVSRR